MWMTLFKWALKPRPPEIGNYTKVIQQPRAIASYNQYMNAVDCSDQLLATNNVNRESMRWWKALFFQLIDIAVVNSFLLFREHQSNFSIMKPCRGQLIIHWPISVKKLCRTFVVLKNSWILLSLLQWLTHMILKLPVCMLWQQKGKSVVCATNRVKVSKECKQSAVPPSVISIHVCISPKIRIASRFSTPGHIKSFDFL